MMKTIVAYIIVSVSAAVAGLGQAYLLSRKQHETAKNLPAPHVPKVAENPNEHDIFLLRLPPVVTNLRNPDSMWIRIDAAISYEKQFEKDVKPMGDKMGQDITIYLRTLSLKELEGSSGLTNLRHDLLERVKIRTGEKAKDLFITTMVVQ